jgi:hypothetical protein
MFRTRELTLLERLTDRTLRELDNHPIGSDEYRKTMAAAVTLHGLKQDEKPRPVSRDTLLIVGGNLLGLILIINHEHLHPITTRALGLILKPRV